MGKYVCFGISAGTLRANSSDQIFSENDDIMKSGTFGGKLRVDLSRKKKSQGMAVTDKYLIFRCDASDCFDFGKIGS